MKLQDLINPQLILEITQNKHKKSILVLSENQNKDNTDALYQVKLQDIPENALAFSLDVVIEIEEWEKGKKTGRVIKDKARNWFLNIPTPTNEEDEPENKDKQEHKRINKVCDAILLVFQDNKVLAYFFEMKSGKLEAGKYEHQLINSKLFVDYLLQVYDTFYAKKYGKIILSEHKFVLFYRGTIFDTHHNIRGRVEIPYEKMELYDEKVFKCAFSNHHHNYPSLEDFD